MMGYCDGDQAIYVSPYNNLNEIPHVSDNIKSSWSSLWHEANDEFDAIFQKDSDLIHFADKMFYVWEGNLVEAYQQASLFGQGLADLS